MNLNLASSLFPAQPATAECGCSSAQPGSALTPITSSKDNDMTTTTATYTVTGMTCGHCVGAVTEELTALRGVTGVNVDLVAGGSSTVAVTSDTPIGNDQVAAALDEAGDYRLADD
jgi:copper chaperone